MLFDTKCPSYYFPTVMRLIYNFQTYEHWLSFTSGSKFSKLTVSRLSLWDQSKFSKSFKLNKIILILRQCINLLLLGISNSEWHIRHWSEINNNSVKIFLRKDFWQFIHTSYWYNIHLIGYHIIKSWSYFVKFSVSITENKSGLLFA